MTIYQRFKHLREQLNIKQQDLADNIGIHRTSISKIEKGELKPGLENLEKLHVNYNINLNWLIAGTGEMKVSNNYEMVSEDENAYGISCKECKQKNETIKALKENNNKAWDQVEFLKSLLMGNK